MAKALDVLGIAPEFELKDTRGQVIRLSDYKGRQPVVLVMTRGFA